MDQVRGHKKILIINSTLNFNIHRFQSNYFENGHGFHLRYESTYDSQWTYRTGECGGNFTTPNGFFTSPSYPHKYPDGVDCIYRISHPRETSFNLTILLLDLNPHRCYDYLEIRDGNSETSPRIDKFCGNKIPATIQATQNNVFIKWGKPIYKYNYGVDPKTFPWLVLSKFFSLRKSVYDNNTNANLWWT